MLRIAESENLASQPRQVLDAPLPGSPQQPGHPQHRSLLSATLATTYIPTPHQPGTLADWMRASAWWAPRSSKPVGGRPTPGGFDSRPPPLLFGLCALIRALHMRSSAPAAEADSVNHAHRSQLPHLCNQLFGHRLIFTTRYPHPSCHHLRHSLLKQQLPVRTKPRVRQFNKYPRLIEGCRQSITFGTGLKVGCSGPDHRFYDYPLLLNAKGQDHVNL